MNIMQNKVFERPLEHCKMFRYVPTGLKTLKHFGVLKRIFSLIWLRNANNWHFNIYISMINTTSERLKARDFFICQYFSFYEQLKFRAQLELSMKKVV